MDSKKNVNTKTNFIYKSIIAIMLFIFAQMIAYFYSPKDSFKLHIIVLFIFTVQWIGFLLSSGLLGNNPTEKYYDITGSLTYISTVIISYISLKNISKRQIITAIATLIWSLRLGIFLFTRISKTGGVDKRFTEIKKDPSDFLLAWTMQGLWVFLTLLSVLSIFQVEDVVDFNFLNFLGILIWLLGFTFEIIADHQKSTFRNNPENKEKWISTGLWSISRHPNYFGEITLWIGVSLMCYTNISNSFKLIISPLFVSCLLIFISGIPILEKNADKKFGKNEDYLKYKSNTPVLIPFIGRAGDSLF